MAGQVDFFMRVLFEKRVLGFLSALAAMIYPGVCLLGRFLSLAECICRPFHNSLVIISEPRYIARTRLNVAFIPIGVIEAGDSRTKITAYRYNGCAESTMAYDLVLLGIDPFLCQLADMAGGIWGMREGIIGIGDRRCRVGKKGMKVFQK